MNRIAVHVAASLTALVALATVQTAVEGLALAVVYRGQVLPPYSFFTTQLYDFLAKVHYFGGALFDWAPALPDRFVGTGVVEHIGVGLALLPATVTVAAVLAVALGVIVGAATRVEKPAATAYLWIWFAVGVVVHIAAFLPSLSLGDSPTLSNIAYRSRSLIVDGGVVAIVVLALSAAVTRLAVLPALGSVNAKIASAVAVAAAAGWIAWQTPTVANPVAPFLPTDAVGPGRLNVVLISLDSLRADHLGCYGYDRDTSPRVDRLASEGIRFENAIATSSWTLPTHLTMFTGRYQLSHGVVHDTITLSPAVPTLGQIMKSVGYSTAGFVSGPYVAGHYGYDRGMDTYVDLSAEYGHRREARSAIVAPAINELALPWIEEHRREPFFLFLHYFDIHYDFVPPPPYDTMFDPDYTGTMDGTDFIERKDVHRNMDPRDLEHILALYDGEIRFTDDYVGQILDKLDEVGLREKTVVVLVSDHGDEFFEHGNKGHHRTVYQEVLRVPFIVRLPDGRHAGLVSDEPVSLVDVMPTILSAVGIRGPVDLEGLDAVALARGEVDARDAVYAEFYDKRGFNVQIARRTKTDKAIQHFNRITHPKRAPLEYYRIDQDPEELEDLAPEAPPSLDASLERMGTWLDGRWAVNGEFQRQAAGANRIEIDDETLERLKSLGYVGE